MKGAVGPPRPSPCGGAGAGVAFAVAGGGVFAGVVVEGGVVVVGDVCADGVGVVGIGLPQGTEGAPLAVVRSGLKAFHEWAASRETTRHW